MKLCQLSRKALRRQVVLTFDDPGCCKFRNRWSELSEESSRFLEDARRLRDAHDDRVGSQDCVDGGRRAPDPGIGKAEELEPARRETNPKLNESPR